MVTRKLTEARDYERKRSELVSDEERPVYHFSPYVGWLNDPNGFSYYNGVYHLFYQYYPYSVYWGPMHWGHAVTEDFINWEYLPCALAPDESYDGAGCFSGSAMTLADGRHLLMYTGCDPVDMDHDGKWKQTQCIAVSKAPGECTEYVKIEANPVIDSDGLPEGGDPYEFRDPYIWTGSDGVYRSLVANANTMGNCASQLEVYRSTDGFKWEHAGVLFKDWRRIGVMWECPNLFEVDGVHILMACPMNMAEEEADGSVRFPKGNNVCYMTGTYDETSENFKPFSKSSDMWARYVGPTYEPVDCGLDFYAPQVRQMPDGRVIMIAWMQDPQTSNYPHDQLHIFGQMTFPRELSMRDGIMIQRPVRELDSIRQTETVHHGIKVGTEELSLEGVRGRVLDMELAIESEDEFTIRFAQSDKYHTELTWKPARSSLTIDRSHSGLDDGYTMTRTVSVRDRDGHLDLRILLDKWSAEIFINGGEEVMSLTYFTDPTADRISFSSTGTASIDVSVFTFEK